MDVFAKLSKVPDSQAGHTPFAWGSLGHAVDEFWERKIVA